MLYPCPTAVLQHDIEKESKEGNINNKLGMNIHLIPVLIEFSNLAKRVVKLLNISTMKSLDSI
jgi:hypothetical protein